MTLKTELIEAMARAVTAEWQLMCKEMDIADAARTFVAPGNYRLHDAALAAIQAHCTPLGIKLTARELDAKMHGAGNASGHHYKDCYQAVWDAAPDLLGGDE